MPALTSEASIPSYLSLFIQFIAYLLRHRVQGHTVGTADASFVAIVPPRAKDQHPPGGTDVEQGIGGFIVVAKVIAIFRVSPLA